MSTVKISLVQAQSTSALLTRHARATPSYTSPESALSAGSAPDLSGRPCPSCVAPASWALLAKRVDDAQGGASIISAPVREVVIALVRELRRHGESWETVYAVLELVVVHTGAPRMQRPSELEIYATRSAALVAHMHCWADVERLAELDRET